MTTGISGNYPPKVDKVTHVEFVELDGTRTGNQVTVKKGTVLPIGNPALEVPKGNIIGQAPVNKFGRSTNVDSGVDTDVWSRANATDDQSIWLAPTIARIHTIQSTSVDDVTGGSGANSIIISYLPDWDSKEVNEIVTGDLNAGIAMINAAVIINRMRVKPQASSTTSNAGTITATAAVDATVTAQIEPGEGQTQMAVYGIPSNQVLYITQFYLSLLRQTGAASFVDMRLLFNPSPDINTIVYLVRHGLRMESTGANPYNNPFEPHKIFEGPAILKMQVTGSAANLIVSGGFDGYLVDK